MIQTPNNILAVCVCVAFPKKTELSDWLVWRARFVFSAAIALDFRTAAGGSNGCVSCLFPFLWYFSRYKCVFLVCIT